LQKHIFMSHRAKLYSVTHLALTQISNRDYSFSQHRFKSDKNSYNLWSFIELTYITEMIITVITFEILLIADDMSALCLCKRSCLRQISVVYKMRIWSAWGATKTKSSSNYNATIFAIFSFSLSYFLFVFQIGNNLHNRIQKIISCQIVILRPD